MHIHSVLSPCGERDMTPVNIVAYAAAMGLEIIAVSDHNAIGNVRAAVEVGEALDVLVVPAAEIQSNEDIHILCLFPDVDSLERFYARLPFNDLKNRPEVFGEQLIVNSDDEVVGTEDRLLLQAVNAGEIEIHVDRTAFGMVAVLGAVPDEYTAVEFTGQGDESGFPGKRVLRSSDAHTLSDIGKNRNFIELPEKTARALIDYLKSGKSG